MSFRFNNSVGSVVWFLRLWLTVAFVVAMLVVLEIVLLAANGHQYHPKEYVEYYGIRDLAVVDSSHLAGVFFFRKREGKQPIHTTLELFDGCKATRSLPLETEPYRIAISAERKLAISTKNGGVRLYELPEPLETGTGSKTQFADLKALVLPSRSRFESDSRMVTDALTPTLLFQPKQHTDLQRLAFSPDGRLLVANGDGFFVWNTTSRERLSIPDMSNEEYLCFYPDSQRVVTTPERGVLRIRDLRAPQTFEDVRIGNEQITAAAIAPNAELVLVSTSEGRLMTWSCQQNRVLWKKHSTQLPLRITMTNDLAIFVAGNGSDVVICDAKSGESRTVVHRHARPLMGLTVVDSILYSWDVGGGLKRMTLRNGRDV